MATDYTNKDFDSMKEYLISRIDTYLPQWKVRTESDFGVVLIELFSLLGDMLNYYNDRLWEEVFMVNSVLGSTIINIATMFGYEMVLAVPSAATVTLSIEAGTNSKTIDAGTKVYTTATETQDEIVFETDETVTIAGLDAATPAYIASVGVTQGQTKSGFYVEDEASAVSIAESTGEANQVFTLFDIDVIYQSESIQVGGTYWSRPTTNNFLNSISTSKHYITKLRDDGRVDIEFGDGINGDIPNTGLQIESSYRVGGGVVGNVGAATIVNIDVAGVTVTNAAVAAGGADAESIAEAKVNIPKYLRTLDRAITLEDHANIALQVSGIAKAAAAVGGTWNEITIYLAPTAGGTASTALKTTVSNYFSDKTMINEVLTMANPTYVDINITGAIVADDTYEQAVVKENVEEALTSLLAFANRDFSQDVNLGDVYSTILAVEGVSKATLTVLSKTGSGLTDITIADIEIAQEGTVMITATGGL
jgi:hypothetical protein